MRAARTAGSTQSRGYRGPRTPMVSLLPSVVSFEAQGVRGRLHNGGDGAKDAMVLTHGAGGNCNAPLLVAVASAFQAAGVTVLRCDLPFRQNRPSGPPGRADSARDRAGLRLAVAALRGIVSGRVVLAGHSYGGRQATMLAADEPELVESLLLLSYPLHPPGKPEQLRTTHFPNLRTQAMFVHGAKDPFGSIGEMETALAKIPVPKRLTVVDGVGHDLRGGRFELKLVVEGLFEFVGW